MADKNYFEKVKASESAGKTNAKNKQSSASGLYQFTKGTWEGLGYNWNDRFNPKLQEEAMVKYTQKADDQFTKALGRIPTDADRYGNHFLGAGTYIKALKAGDNALISNVVSSAAYNANKSVMQKNGKPITVGELKNWLNKKMGSPTTEVSQTSQQEEQTPYINPIDFNTPEYSGMTFSEEESEQEQTPQQASQDLLEESFLEEADAIQTQQEQPIQEYAPAPQYNVELNPIEYQPIAQFQSGGSQQETEYETAMRGMMKSKIGMGNAMNNPAIVRMSQSLPKTGMTPEGIGTHYMSSMDNYAIPFLQDTGKEELQYMENPGLVGEAIRFNSNEEADYFAKNYKQVAPMSNYQQGGQIPVSSRGVYDFPNQEVIVPTEDGKITMKNIDYSIIGTDEFGNRQLMQPDGEYQFPGKIIHEIPQTKRLKNKRFK